MSLLCRNWSGRLDDYFIGHTHTLLSREHFVANLFLFGFIAFRYKKRTSASSLPVVDVGVAVPRHEPNLNNLFRLPTAFDITLKLEEMYPFFPSSIGVYSLSLSKAASSF